MRARLADLIAAVLAAGVLTCWAQGYWPVALVETGGFVVAGIWLAWAAITRQTVPTGFELLPVAGVVAWGILQMATGRSVDRFETAKAVLAWAAYAAVFLVAREVSMRTPERNRLLRSVLWLGALVSLLTVVQYFSSGGKVFWLFGTDQERVLGPFLYKNQCAAFLELVFPLAVYQSLADRRQPLVYVAMAAAMFAAMMAAVSRAGVLIMVVELITILLLAWCRGLMTAGNLRRTSLWIAALGLVLAAVVGSEVTIAKFREPEPYRVRRELLLSSLAMIADRPWTGFGLGAWPAVYPAYARFDNGLAANHAHNDWAEWAAEGGLPFLALLAMFAVWSIRPAADSLWGIGVPAVFVHSLVDYPLREPALAVLLFLLSGALAGRQRNASWNMRKKSIREWDRSGRACSVPTAIFESACRGRARPTPFRAHFA
ncbi:MAG: O-antigen ligase family protein [Acidobacteriia bacterium]|nr:O-antigen ligase family protein [Terriglobia bacterium]